MVFFLKTNLVILKQIVLICFFFSCARVNPAQNSDVNAIKKYILDEYLRQEAAKSNLVISNTVLQDGTIETVINASYLDLVARYDFATKAQSNDFEVWDIAFERFKVKTNSGASNSLGKGGACSTGTTNFQSISKVSDSPTTCDFKVDESNVTVNVGDNVTGSQGAVFGLPYIGSPVLRDWYNYTIGELTPSNKVYIVRSSDGFSFYKIQIRGYYNSAGTSGFITFWWKQISV
jgi:hypothetical protein